MHGPGRATRRTGPGRLARMQQTVVLALLVLVAAWIAWAWPRDPKLAVAGLLAASCLHPLALALELWLVRATHGADPTPRADRRALAHAWRAETLASIRVFLWQQPFRSQRWPDHLPTRAPQAPAQRGVLLVHGYVCNRGFWNRWLAQLTASGTPFVAVNLEPVFGTIEATAGVIETAVQRLEACSGLPPIVVAHSMGGLAVRSWWAGQPCTRLHHVITLGTPHQGTWLARWGPSRNAQQMRPGSTWLQALAQREPPGRARAFTCFYSHSDNVVFPPRYATLPGAVQRHLQGCGHVHLATTPGPWQELQHKLR